MKQFQIHKISTQWKILKQKQIFFFPFNNKTTLYCLEKIHT